MPANFEFTIKSDNAGTSNDDQFTLPLPGAGVYDCIIDWGDGSAPEVKNTNTSITHTFLGGAGTYSISISGTFPQIYFNNGGDKLKLLSVEQLGDVGWTSFANAFFGCSSMTSFVGGTTDTSSVTTMSHMFYGCSSLTTLDVSGFDTGNVETMYRVFYGCSSLTTLDLSGWDTGNVETMYYMFYGCSSLTTLDVSSWDTGLVTVMEFTFYGCSSLTTLDVSSWDTGLVTVMNAMFQGCSSLSTLNLSGWDTGLVTTMNAMFYNSSSLDVDISAFDITSMTNAGNMFSGSGFGQVNYDKLLISWEAQVEQPNVTFHAGTAQYSAGAPTVAKAALALNGWNITDGGQSTIIGWSDETNATILSDTSPHSGTKCMKVTAGAANVGARQNVNLVAGRSYTVTIYAKVTAGDTAALVVDTGDGTIVTLDSTTSTIWTMLQGTFIATGANGEIYLRGVANGDIVWFDDMSMLINDYADAETDDRIRDFAGGRMDGLEIHNAAIPAAGIKRLRDLPHEMLL